MQILTKKQRITALEAKLTATGRPNSFTLPDRIDRAHKRLDKLECIVVELEATVAAHAALLTTERDPDPDDIDPNEPIPYRPASPPLLELASICRQLVEVSRMSRNSIVWLRLPVAAHDRLCSILTELDGGEE